MATFKEEALRLAEYGLAVFPLCERDKTPAVTTGFKAAMTDAEAIERAWTKRPECNIGIATGTPSNGIIVIDFDNHDVDGMDYLHDWESEHGELPETASAKSGSGGYHLYYRANTPIESSVNSEIAVDIRGDGGYIVAPPSIHPNGQPYAWENDPDDVQIARADENVLAFIRSVQSGKSKGKRFVLPDGDINKGERDNTLFKLAASLQSRGLSDDEIGMIVSGVNEAKCKPPLPGNDIVRIINSALLYGKGIKKQDADIEFITTKNGAIQSCTENCVRAMLADSDLNGRFYYDSMAHTRKVVLPLPWDDHQGEREIKDADYASLTAYLEHKYRIMNAKSKAIDAVVIIAEHDVRNPLCEWLESLVWDGTERVCTMLPVFLGSPANDYTAAVMRIVMLGAVARVYDPGCKFDYCMILTGRQGLGKSYFVGKMAHKTEWYNDNLSTIEGDAAIEKIRGKWIVELAELLATKRAKDVESIKSFITTQNDTIRPKYMRETENWPRRCIFIGTTNSNSFLVDNENRRFLPVPCGQNEPLMSMFDDGADAYFEQAWAEAVHIYKTEHPALVLDENMRTEAIKMQDSYREDDPRIGIIQNHLDEILAKGIEEFWQPYDLRWRVCAQELIDCLPDAYKKITARILVADVHNIMRNSVNDWCDYGEILGKGAKQRTVEYGIQRVYVPKMLKEVATT